MTEGLAQIVVWLNAVANTCGQVVLAPIALLPGWLSATIAAAVTGVLLLLAYKYTSNQGAVKRARNSIKANLLATKLFKDSTPTVFRAQGGILLGALRLFLLSLVPMLVMAVPVTLMMTQLALWYQARPLQIGEEAVLALQLSADADTAWPEIRLDPSEAVEVTAGPVCAYSERTVVWNIVARQPGTSQLVFHVDDLAAEKELAVNAGFTRVSLQRPSWKWYDALLHPWEAPFRPDSAVQSIEIVYPERDSWTSGTNNWIVYWFGASMVAALCFRPWLNVNI